MSAEEKAVKKAWLLEKLRSTGGMLIVTTVFVLPPVATAIESLKTAKDQSINGRVAAVRSKLQNAGGATYANNSGSPASYAKDGFDKAFDKAAFEKGFDKVAHAKDWDKVIV
jgi:hypothetical protein